MQCPHGVEDGEHGHTDIGEYRHPQGGHAAGCENEYQQLDADGEPEVILY